MLIDHLANVFWWLATYFQYAAAVVAALAQFGCGIAPLATKSRE